MCRPYLSDERINKIFVTVAESALSYEDPLDVAVLSLLTTEGEWIKNKDCAIHWINYTARKILQP